jgi:hypothetical protein
MSGSRLGLATADPDLISKLLLVAGLATFIFFLFEYRTFFDEDTYIELRYARNLLQLGAFVWNPGEKIQGFTSPLHLLLVAAAGKLGISLPVAARLVNVLSLATLFVFFRLALRDLGLSPRTRAVAWLLLLTSAPLVAWLYGGLEGPLAAALVCMAFALGLRVLRGDRSVGAAVAAGCAFALAAFTRLDQTVYLGAFLIAWLSCWRTRREHFWKISLLLVIPTCLMLLAQAMFGLWYFDDALPNTYYAKVGIPLFWRLRTGALYIFGCIGAEPQFMLVGLCCLFGLLAGAVKTPVRIALLLAGTAAVTYVWWVGGDYMPNARFFVPLIAPAVLLTAALIDDPRFVSVRALVIPAALACALLTVFRSFSRPVVTDIPTMAAGLVGRYINDAWPRGSTVALNTIGAIPYFAPNLRFIDMLGITDRNIARRVVGAMPGDSRMALSGGVPLPGHAKGDGHYVLMRKPGFVIIGGPIGHDINEPVFRSDFELAGMSQFSACYTKQTADIPFDESAVPLGPRWHSPLQLTYYRRICPE